MAHEFHCQICDDLRYAAVASRGRAVCTALIITLPGDITMSGEPASLSLEPDDHIHFSVDNSDAWVSLSVFDNRESGFASEGAPLYASFFPARASPQSFLLAMLLCLAAAELSGTDFEDEASLKIEPPEMHPSVVRRLLSLVAERSFFDAARDLEAVLKAPSWRPQSQ